MTQITFYDTINQSQLFGIPAYIFTGNKGIIHGYIFIVPERFRLYGGSF